MFASFLRQLLFRFTQTGWKVVQYLETSSSCLWDPASLVKTAYLYRVARAGAVEIFFRASHIHSKKIDAGVWSERRRRDVLPGRLQWHGGRNARRRRVQVPVLLGKDLLSKRRDSDPDLCVKAAALYFAMLVGSADPIET